MPGRKQHFIPQSLLKGFCAWKSRKSTFVHVFEISGTHYPASTADVAAMRDFYSDPPIADEATVDDLVGKYENELAAQLMAIRSKAHAESVDSKAAAELVVHLTVRASYIRDIFDHGIDTIFDNIMALFVDKERTRAHLGLDALELPPGIAEAIDQGVLELKAQSPESVPLEVLKRMALVQMRENFDDIHTALSSSASALVNQLQGVADQALRRGHAQSLTNNLTPEARVAELRALNWTVFHADDNALILPDCLAITAPADQSVFTAYLMTNAADLAYLMIPVSSTRLLVGSRPDSPPIATGAFNEAAAKCSMRFFVSASATEDVEAWSKLIGVTPLQQMAAATKDVVAEVREQPPSNSSSRREGRDEVVGDPAGDGSSCSFQLHFHSWESREAVEEIGHVVRKVVELLSGHLPLNRLESITYSDDPKAVLAGLTPTYSDISAVSSGTNDDSLGVAWTPVVRRDDELKIAVIIEGWLGRALLNEEPAVGTALQILVSALAKAAHLELFHRSFPDESWWHDWDYLQRLQFDHMYTASATYYSAYYSATFYEDATSYYRTLFLQSLENADGYIPDQRRAYRRHGNIDTFLNSAVSSIGQVLEFAARLLGHCDALNVPLDDQSKLFTAALERHGLGRWIELYRRDLRATFGRRNQWSSIDEFTRFNIHSERMLWRYAIFPWKQGDSQIRVEVPPAVDADFLAVAPTVK